MITSQGEVDLTSGEDERFGNLTFTSHTDQNVLIKVVSVQNHQLQIREQWMTNLKNLQRLEW